MKVMGIVLGWVLLTIFILPPLVMAQQVTPITERPRPDYDARGIQAGAFNVRPEVTLGLEFNDNIFATRRDEESDFIVVLAPRVDIRSNWSTHFLRIDTGLRNGMYVSESDENYLDGHIFLDGRVDVLRQSFLTGRAGFQRLHEARGAPDAEGEWDEPGVLHRSTGLFSYYHGRGKTSITAGTGIVNLNYQSVKIDGVSTSQDDRDRNVYNVNARIAYELQPSVTPFITTHYEWRRYDENARIPGNDDEGRDSEGFRIGIGTGVELTGVTSIEIYAGHMSQNYEEISNISGFWYGMSLLWNPTQLTSVQSTAETSIRETTTTGSSGIEAFDVWIRLDHEFLRNLLAGVYFNYTDNDYKNVDLKDEYYSLGPRVNYLWNPNLSAEAGYTHRIRDSNDRNREYTENRFHISITGRF